MTQLPTAFPPSAPPLGSKEPMALGPAASSSTAFRAIERTFKARSDPATLASKSKKARRAIFRPSLETVVDLRSYLLNLEGAEDEVAAAGWGAAQRRLKAFEVGRGKGKGRAWSVEELPGLVVFPSYLSPAEQKALIIASISRHTRAPNQTNLDTHFILPSSLWDLARSSPEELVPSRASLEPTPRAKPAVPPPRKTLVQNLTGEEVLAQRRSAAVAEKEAFETAQASYKMKPTAAATLLRDLRWTNIGLYYDWTSKSYDFETPIAFPKDVATLATRVTSEIDWSAVFTDYPRSEADEEIAWNTWDDYEPDAGIINFYQPSDTLMGHVDRSELDPHRPLVSVSLGLSAVFLIGGSTRDVEPVPILLRSGDVLVLSGPCRRAYHGIPRVLDGTLPTHLQAVSLEDGGGVDDEWTPFAEFMASTRLNINARQVFPSGYER